MQKCAFVTGLIFALLGCSLSRAQIARLRGAEMESFPTLTDGNTPSFWYEGKLRMFSSIGRPLKISEWDNGAWQTADVAVPDLTDLAIWVESAWVDADSTVFGWYHHEPGGLYEGSKLTAPKIGAVVSFDGGRTVRDLGFVLVSGDPLDPEAKNGAFTGGHGDFSVVLDRERKYFYFFFTNYGGDAASQGVAVARMAFADRFEPVGKVHKFHQGEWNEPGVGGRMTPILPAARAWQHADPDSYWGPALHWNRHLGCFVMLLNRTQGEPGWSQEGIYVSYSTDLSQPAWKAPAKLLDTAGLPDWGLWYPQVMGLGAGETDSEAGATARFFINGISAWEIDFIAPTEPADRGPIAPPKTGLKPPF
jgi:hypothetical protein